MIKAKTKVCSKCKKRKSLGQFYRRGDSSHGYFSHCKACFISCQKKINQKTKEKNSSSELKKESTTRKSLKNILNLGKTLPQDKKRFPQFGKFWDSAPMNFLFPKGFVNVKLNNNIARRVIKA